VVELRCRVRVAAQALTIASNLKSLAGKQKITLELRGNPMAPRYLNGNITRMTLSGREAGGNRYYIYRAVLRPSSDFRSRRLSGLSSSTSNSNSPASLPHRKGF
ncbi:hypothetical protein ISX56_29245, partial [Serratia ureilytica]|nr:hypothetical protein [Serratia ureilytica]